MSQNHVLVVPRGRSRDTTGFRRSSGEVCKRTVRIREIGGNVGPERGSNESKREQVDYPDSGVRSKNLLRMVGVAVVARFATRLAADLTDSRTVTVT